MPYDLSPEALAQNNPSPAALNSMRRLAHGFFRAVESQNTLAALEFIGKEPLLGLARRHGFSARDTGLGVAVSHGDLPMVQALLPFSDARDKNGAESNLFFEALRFGCFEIAAALFPAMDPGELNAEGQNMALAAAAAGAAEPLRLALAHCDPDARDTEGETALTLAASSNHVECLSALLARRAPDAPADALFHALFRAACQGHAESAALLLSGAPGAARESSTLGLTPLMGAATRHTPRNAQTIGLLLPASDLAARDCAGRSAMDIAWNTKYAPSIDEFAPFLPRDELRERFERAREAGIGDLPKFRARIEALELAEALEGLGAPQASPFAQSGAPAGFRSKRPPRSL